jgi:hypothetical protein
MADVVLHGAGCAYRLPPLYWADLVGVAIDYGWRPSPTSVCERDGAVCELVLDRVTDTDARQLADALDRALDDIPDDDVLSQQKHGLAWDIRLIGSLFLCEPPSRSKWLRGANQQLAHAMIAFARQGAFRVLDPTS